jgi:hypothetical protein
LAYQPPASSIFLSQQTNHQQSVSSTFLSERTSTSHQPPVKRTGCKLVEYTLRPKTFALFDFYRERSTIRLIQKICANAKTIMIYLEYI